MRDGFHDPDAGTTEVERDDRDRTFNEYSDDISEGGEGPSTMDHDSLMQVQPRHDAEAQQLADNIRKVWHA